ncbi:GGDEF domain-containing protein [Pseudomonas oryzihabitans]|uniref:GGDEF domain-containing protein n=1 Tax=Pseudomonas oryzihabitans TaxID=47885 RepID=UPI002B1E7881|nr:GGDEF domain-containing protein [Pseudomonas oryzihabitans]
MLLTIIPDLSTLFMSSALSRSAFLLVFLVLLIRQPKARYLRHWTLALIASTVGLFITVEYAANAAMPLPIAFLSYSLLLGSLATSWTGLRLFYGRTVNVAFLPLLTVFPSALYVFGTSLEVSARWLLPIIYTMAALAAGLALLEILRASSRGLLTSYLVAAAFAIYFLALVVPAVLILMALIPAAVNSGSLPAILLDQATSVLVYFGYIAMASERATLDLRKQATTDPMTLSANRRGGEPVLEMLFRRRMEGRCCSVILADIDHFKAVNDTWGHGAGDRILVSVAARLAACLRRGDLLVRWGGEEFLIILPDTSLSEAKVSAERLRIAIANEPFPIEQVVLSVTLSLGCAEINAADLSYEDSLQRADKALYRAKETGRDKVCYEQI